MLRNSIIVSVLIQYISVTDRHTDRQKATALVLFAVKQKAPLPRRAQRVRRV